MSLSPIDDPTSGPALLRLKNLAASTAIVAVACVIYGLAPYNRRQVDTLYGSPAFSFTGRAFLCLAALAYVGALAIYFLGRRYPLPSKSLRLVRILVEIVRSPRWQLRRSLSAEERLAVLATLLKAFFGPLMAMSLMGFCIGAIDHGSAAVADAASPMDLRTLFDRHGYWVLMQIILFVDVLIFTVGYLVELPALGNAIRSVDPTLLGWTAALLCYPPFNTVSGAILGSPRSDFPQFDDPTTHLVLNLALLLLMAIYAWASVSLGLKASNLTHRGIVGRGPYRVIRHPAYTCKNLAWWIGSAPLVMAGFDRSAFDGLQVIASVAGWTLLYVLRALTEEDHLRHVDGDYAAYAARVRFRFVPGLI
jgi:protein-S-isoprenylcysteine O-methyltransferase Ste14